MTDRDEVKAQDAHKVIIDRTLAALGGAAAPDGMQARVLMAAQARMQTLPRRWALSFPAALATACVCGFVLTAEIVVRHRHIARDFRTVNVSKADSHPISAVQTPMPTHAPLTAQRPGRPATSQSGVVHSNPAMRESALPHPTEQAAEYDHPAPPLPLTDQEKLLLRIAHRGDPVEMAALDDAATRNIDFQAQKAQFDDFFYLHATETSNEDQ